MARILIVDDDESLGDTVRQTLAREMHTVEVCTNGADAEAFIQAVDFDLLILDWGLPDTTGLEICRLYRSRGGASPVLFLTARTAIREKTLAFTSGSDDFLTKPFDMRELVLRISALLKRPKQVVQFNLKAGDIELDWMQHKVYKNGQQVQLSPMEFQLLEFFVRHPNQSFSHEALLSRIWPGDSEATMEAVKATVKRIRQKIDPDQKLLRTIHGVGYIFELKSG